MEAGSQGGIINDAWESCPQPSMMELTALSDSAHHLHVAAQSAVNMGAIAAGSLPRLPVSMMVPHPAVNNPTTDA